MRKRFLLSAQIIFLAACSTMNAVDQDAKLTPYVTDTEAATPVQVTATIESDPQPQPTQAPVIHIVALGETISSIALRYGVTIDAIVVANPGIQPTVMIVGDEVVIPLSSRREEQP